MQQGISRLAAWRCLLEMQGSRPEVGLLGQPYLPLRHSQDSRQSDFLIRVSRGQPKEQSEENP
jgi:hypothetical protein